MSVISAGTTSTTAFKVTSDTTGTLQLKTGAASTTAIDISASQVVTFPATTTLDFTGSLLLGDGSASAPTLAHSGDTNTGIYFPGADQIAITTAGTQRLLVDATGNAGLGVTPSAWNSYKGLQITGGGSFVAFGNAAEIWSNSFYDGANNKYIANGFATRYHLNNNGAHAWYIAASGVAGNNISFTQALTLTAGGELLLGTTASGGYQMAVSGATTGGVTGIKLINTGTTSSSGNLNMFVAGSSYGSFGVSANSGWLCVEGANNLTVGPTGAGAVTFVANGSERARLDSSGNMYLGLTGTPSGWGSSLKFAIRQATSSTYTGFACFAAGNDNAITMGHSGTVAQIGVTYATGSYTPLVFDVGGSQRLAITTGGCVLAGTNDNFSIAGTTFINSSPTNCIFANTTSAAGVGYLLFQGRSGAANVNSPGTTVINITDNGNVTNTNNSYGAISDERIKQDIVDAASQWDDIKGLRVRKFRYKATPFAPLQIGLIAQETETVSPGLIEEIYDQEEVEIVDENGNVKKEARIAKTGTKSVKYSVLYMKSIKALQEAMLRIENLEAEVNALKAN